MGEWIEWKGGNCPLKPGVKTIEVRLRKNGEFITNHGQHLRWDHGADDGDIVAYRIILQDARVKENEVLTPTTGSVTSDGASTSYYKLTITNEGGDSIECEMGDVIRCVVGDNFSLGNILKACRRMYEASQGRGKQDVSIKYDANKVGYFAQDFAKFYKER